MTRGARQGASRQVGQNGSGRAVGLPADRFGCLENIVVDNEGRAHHQPPETMPMMMHLMCLHQRPGGRVWPVSLGCWVAALGREIDASGALPWLVSRVATAILEDAKGPSGMFRSGQDFAAWSCA